MKPIKLDRVRNFLFTIDSPKLYKAVTGNSYDKFMQNGFDGDELVAYLYCGFRHEDHNITIEQLHDILVKYDLNDLLFMLQEANIIPKGDEEVKNAQVPDSTEI